MGQTRWSSDFFHKKQGVPHLPGVCSSWPLCSNSVCKSIYTTRSAHDDAFKNPRSGDGQVAAIGCRGGCSQRLRRSGVALERGSCV